MGRIDAYRSCEKCGLSPKSESLNLIGDSRAKNQYEEKFLISYNITNSLKMRKVDDSQKF